MKIFNQNYTHTKGQQKWSKMGTIKLNKHVSTNLKCDKSFKKCSITSKSYSKPAQWRFRMWRGCREPARRCASCMSQRTTWRPAISAAMEMSVTSSERSSPLLNWRNGWMPGFCAHRTGSWKCKYMCLCQSSNILSSQENSSFLKKMHDQPCTPTNLDF